MNGHRNEPDTESGKVCFSQEVYFLIDSGQEMKNSRISTVDWATKDIADQMIS